MKSSVLVVDTGVGNLASVLAAFARLGAAARASCDPDAIAAAPFVVLPGVGTFAAGMAALRRHGLDRALRARIAADRPLLAICLGLQLLGERSEESPGVDGLGVLAAKATRFAPPLRVPQLGWNEVTPEAGLLALPARAHFYFANSFHVQHAASDCHVATADYGGPFLAALARGALLACQFHPELSGQVGAALLRRWLDRGAA